MNKYIVTAKEEICRDGQYYVGKKNEYIYDQDENWYDFFGDFVFDYRLSANNEQEAIQVISSETGIDKQLLIATQILDKDNIGETSDGSHTFNELYYHRMMLFSIICNTYKDKAWKSLKHHDDTMYDDYFIVGITTPEGDYTYHYHIDHWDMFNVVELKNAPEWDGHTPKDITRLISLLS